MKPQGAALLPAVAAPPVAAGAAGEQPAAASAASASSRSFVTRWSAASSWAHRRSTALSFGQGASVSMNAYGPTARGVEARTAGEGFSRHLRVCEFTGKFISTPEDTGPDKVPSTPSPRPPHRNTSLLLNFPRPPPKSGMRCIELFMAAGVAAVSHFVITFGGVLCAFATRKLVSILALPDVYVVRKVDYNHVRIWAMHTRSVLARMVITAAILAAC